MEFCTFFWRENSGASPRFFCRWQNELTVGLCGAALRSGILGPMAPKYLADFAAQTPLTPPIPCAVFCGHALRTRPQKTKTHGPQNSFFSLDKLSKWVIQ
jgi:hypothetical protein